MRARQQIRLATARDGVRIAYAPSGSLCVLFAEGRLLAGAMEPRFQKVLVELTNEAQMARIQAALGPLVGAVGKVAAAGLH